MCLLAILCAICQLEEHRICDVQPGELVESTRWEEHLAAMVCLLALWAGKHGDGITTKIFIEASRDATTSERLIHGHGIVFLVEIRVELAE